MMLNLMLGFMVGRDTQMVQGLKINHIIGGMCSRVDKVRDKHAHMITRERVSTSRIFVSMSEPLSSVYGFGMFWLSYEHHGMAGGKLSLFIVHWRRDQVLHDMSSSWPITKALICAHTPTICILILAQSIFYLLSF